MNENTEQLASDKIDVELTQWGWLIHNKNQINLNAALGIAIREYQTDIGPAGYVLSVTYNPLASSKPSVQDKRYTLSCMKNKRKVTGQPN